jgi:lysophospholipase L1-like esterase
MIRVSLAGVIASLAAMFAGLPVFAQTPASDALPTIFVAGDSTAANGSEGARGWGRHLENYFDAERVRVENRARGGRSSRTFVTEGLWAEIRSQLRPGDIVLLQFGHNDGGAINDPQRARGSLRGLGDATEAIDNLQTGEHEVVRTFGWYMRKMIAETREQGAHPVLLSLTVRNLWSDGRVERGSGEYGRWSRELAESEDVMFLDVTNLAADLYERMGESAVAELFPLDHVHNSDEGARLNAEIVTQLFNGLREEGWSHWLSAAGRALPRAEPRYVRIASVRPGEDGMARFLNTPQRADDALPSIWLVGDSTVRTGRGRGEQAQFGWGDPLQNAIDLTRVNVVNRALGGSGARTFRTGGYWQPVLEQIEPGDVVLIQFGHNDNGERGALPGVGDETEIRQRDDGAVETVATFGEYLRRFVGEIREKQATPVLFSLIPRKIRVNGQIVRSDDSHQAWARQVSVEEQVLFVDLYERIAQKYDAMGTDAVDQLFADAAVHTSYAGAVLNANTVVEGLRALARNPVQQYLLENN